MSDEYGVCALSRGVSHNPAEFCKEEDCALGAQVLMQSVLRFDLEREL